MSELSDLRGVFSRALASYSRTAELCDPVQQTNITRAARALLCDIMDGIIALEEAEAGTNTEIRELYAALNRQDWELFLLKICPVYPHSGIYHHRGFDAAKLARQIRAERQAAFPRQTWNASVGIKIFSGNVIVRATAFKFARPVKPSETPSEPNMNPSLRITRRWP